jgi:hypothetical protein
MEIKLLLYGTWNGNDHNLPQDLPIKDGSFFFSFNFCHPAEDNYHCTDTDSSTLTP